MPIGSSIIPISNYKGTPTKIKRSEELYSLVKEKGKVQLKEAFFLGSYNPVIEMARHLERLGLVRINRGTIERCN